MVVVGGGSIVVIIIVHLASVGLTLIAPPVRKQWVPGAGLDGYILCRDITPSPPFTGEMASCNEQGSKVMALRKMP